MPNGNVLAPLRVPGVGTLQGLQMPDIAGAIQRRRENLLAGEERRHRMGIAEERVGMERERLGIARGREQRDIEAGERATEEAERKQEEEERKLAKEKWDFYVDLAKKIKSQDDQEWARRVVEEMYGEDVPLFDQTFGDTYDKEAVARVKRGLKEVEPLVKLKREEGLYDPVAREWVVEPEAAEVEGPELSQAVKDVLAENRLTEETASPMDIKAARDQIRKEKATATAKEAKPQMVTMTDVVSGRRFPVERDSEEHAAALAGGAMEGEYPAGKLPLSPEQMIEKHDDRIRTLATTIARLRSTGGAEPHMVIAALMGEDAAAALKALTEGKVDDLVKELESQLKRAIAGRDALLGVPPTASPAAERQIPVGATAINDATGERMRWDGRQWQPIQ